MTQLLVIGTSPSWPKTQFLLSALGLPTRVPDEVTASAIWSVMATDQKRVANPLRFVLPRALAM